MGPDLRINWVDVCSNPNDYERLVKLLLQRLHPDGEVIDGRGGDGGREFQIRTATSLIVFEAKSFIDRIRRRNPNRRRQVEDSLTTAANLQPDEWHLVVPIDHNEDELAWFDTLRFDYPFVGEWRGQTWLEEQLAQHEDLVRYATQDKLLEYVRASKIEQEALANGGADLIERYRKLDRLANEVNPYWKPTVGQFPDGTWYASVEAKHPDAATEAPITFTLGLDISPDSEHDALREMWRTHLELGTGATITREHITEFRVDGPTELGLPDDGVIPDAVEFVPIAITDVSQLPLQTLEVFEPDVSTPVATLHFRPERQEGRRLIAYDAARTVKLTTDIRADSIRITLAAQPAETVTPADYRFSLRFARALVPPNSLVLTATRDGERRVRRATIDEPFLENPPHEKLLTFFDDLAVVQEALGTSFPAPAEFTDNDADIVSKLRHLVDGEQVRWRHGSLRVTIWPDRVQEFRNDFTTRPSGNLLVTYNDLEVAIGDYTVHTGPLWLIGEIAVDVDALTLDETTGHPVVIFDIVGDGWMYAKLGGPLDHEDSQPELPTGTARVRVQQSPG